MTGTFFGIEIKISFLFFSLLAFLFFTSTNVVLTYAILFVVLHELGHVIAMRLKGDAIKRIVLKPFGVAIVKKNNLSLSYQDEMFIYLAGPLFNFILALLCLLLFQGTTIFDFALCSTVNCLLALFNLLPISVLDGGQILKMKWLEKYGSEIGERRFFFFSTFLSLFLLAGALYGVLFNQWNITLPVTAFYLLVSNFKRR